ncbi:hypothetical protein J2T09_004663 [Neorhizobium huautlense]|uniref:Transmembrane protein n=1 Tax=Neorhizobium huautlense TaxID=67774 RepID=A0ABT9Q0M2_9HYPH|nr:hypothetical protein [Neorhizobium huautlense]
MCDGFSACAVHAHLSRCDQKGGRRSLSVGAKDRDVKRDSSTVTERSRCRREGVRQCLVLVQAIVFLSIVAFRA